MFSSNTSQVADGGYQISRSLRFNSADSAYLNRTPVSAGNRKTWTVSCWVKRGEIGTRQGIFGNPDASGLSGVYCEFISDVIQFGEYSTVGWNWIFNTSAVYRDPSAWYHFVFAVDTTQATASNRVKIYVNGVQVTSFSTATYPSQNSDTFWNNTQAAAIGRLGLYSGFYFGGYITEIYNIDGQALTPSSFGETNAQTGVWQPKAYSGSYGTNGFYLNFSDNSNTTAATLGKDYSGNGNNWTPNNFSVTAGAGNDSLMDTPTPYGSDSGAGGEVRGNYCTLNPVFKVGAGTPSYDNGNLDMTAGGTGDSYFAGTTVLTEGKWYYEATITSVGNGILIGVCRVTDSQTIGNLGSYRNTSVIYNLDGTTQTAGATYTTNDVIGVAIDIDNGTVKFYKNNVGQGATNSFTFTAGTPLIVRGRSNSTTSTVAFNFGQRPFAYTAPSGFKALCTQNLPTPTIGATTATQAGKYFDVVLRNGGGSSGGTYSTTVDMSSGALLWDKPRNQASSNYLVDSVRGISKNLRSNTTDAEATDASWFTNFGSSSFTTGSSDWGTGTTVVDWIWAANGSGSTNTAGSITSTVSANTTSGFSIVTYTGTGANATIGHGLGVAPRMIIVKRRDSVEIWPVYHESIGNTQYLRLQGDNPAGTFNVWQNTSPTSSVFYISTDSTVNTNTGTYVAYCFAPIAGFSAFGSYTGNGSSDGAFVYCGFRPKYVLVKRTDLGFGWWVFDGTRNPTNIVDKYLSPNLSDAEYTFGVLDFTSNGFKFRDSSQGWNASGGTYIFAAFAEVPQKFALAR